MKKCILTLGFICFAFLVRTQTNVSFYSTDSFRLDATLTLPDHVNKPPVLVLIHGSGQVNRDSEIHITNQPNFPCIYPDLVGQTSRFFKDIADSLKDAGIAVLRYDKRTTRSADIDIENLTVYDFALDVKAAVEFLQARSDVDTSNIFLLGHSQGSSVAASVVAELTGIRGVISAAGSSTRIDTLYADQVYRIQAECNDDSATGAMQRIQVLAAMQQVQQGLIPDSVPVMGAYPPFWRSWIGISDSAVHNFQQAGIPLLVLQGDADFNVPVEEVERYENIDPAKTELHILEGINHFFNNGSVVKTDGQTLELIIEFILNNRETTGVFDFKKNEDKFYRMYRNRNRVRLVNETAELMYINTFDLAGRRTGGSTTRAYGEFNFELIAPVTLVNVRAGVRSETVKIPALR